MIFNSPKVEWTVRRVSIDTIEIQAKPNEIFQRVKPFRSVPPDEFVKFWDWLKSFIDASPQTMLSFDLEDGTVLELVNTDGPTALALLGWLQHNMFMEVVPTECPECWGTGFRSGYGAPCSKRCKP